MTSDEAIAEAVEIFKGSFISPAGTLRLNDLRHTIRYKPMNRKINEYLEKGGYDVIRAMKQEHDRINEARENKLEDLKKSWLSYKSALIKAEKEYKDNLAAQEMERSIDFFTTFIVTCETSIRRDAEAYLESHELVNSDPFKKRKEKIRLYGQTVLDYRNNLRKKKRMEHQKQKTTENKAAQEKVEQDIKDRVALEEAKIRKEYEDENTRLKYDEIVLDEEARIYADIQTIKHSFPEIEDVPIEMVKKFGEDEIVRFHYVKLVIDILLSLFGSLKGIVPEGFESYKKILKEPDSENRKRLIWKRFFDALS